MAIKQCPACGQSFQPRPQVPLQTYCSAPSCQQHRKRQWHRNKLKTDPDYQENQQRAQQSWIERNPDYWRQYRKSHPKYVDRNRTLQRTRNAKAKTNPIANMDASTPAKLLPSGIYRLSLVTEANIAKMDAWIVEITAHACECRQ
ncbi:hypothetical protein [Methylomonas sp. 11b]|uniref:hypothetical protein n=1 Tax=Methylomonas sp. 11b TaxID=1168169 RepID=UPI0009DF341F|nr:hypothetical protein [Methylomonas sp. 11b]